MRVDHPKIELPRGADEHEHRALVDALLASFAGAPAPPPGPEWSATRIGVLARLREAFVAAGLERVRGMLRAPAWLQLGVTFASAEQRERFQASGRLRRAVAAWRAKGRVQQFWFMNKPPGMRLRLLVPDADPSVEAEVVALLERARALDLLEGHELGMYDAETHQFGGETGLGIFHEFSTYDSLCSLRFKEHEATGAATIDRTVLSLLALGDLFAAVTGDHWEQWDIWCQMRLTGRLLAGDDESTAALREGFEENRALLESIVFRRHEVIARLHPTEAAIVEAYEHGNRRVALALAQACRDRALTHPPRKLLPFFVIFHWNRLGVDIDEQITLSFAMHTLLDPKESR